MTLSPVHERRERHCTVFISFSFFWRGGTQISGWTVILGLKSLAAGFKEVPEHSATARPQSANAATCSCGRQSRPLCSIPIGWREIFTEVVHLGGKALVRRIVCRPGLNMQTPQHVSSLETDLTKSSGTSRVLVGVTGSVAALKLPLLVSQLLQLPGVS